METVKDLIKGIKNIKSHGINYDFIKDKIIDNKYINYSYKRYGIDIMINNKYNE